MKIFQCKNVSKVSLHKNFQIYAVLGHSRIVDLNSGTVLGIPGHLATMDLGVLHTYLIIVSSPEVVWNNNHHMHFGSNC